MCKHEGRVERTESRCCGLTQSQVGWMRHARLRHVKLHGESLLGRSVMSLIGNLEMPWLLWHLNGTRLVVLLVE